MPAGKEQLSGLKQPDRQGRVDAATIRKLLAADIESLEREIIRLIEKLREQ